MFKNAAGDLITLLTWLAPVQNVDGSTIDYALTYQLYVDNVATMTFPGSLNPDGKYTFPLADVPALDEPGEYSITLTAFPEGVDLEQEPGRESDQSGAIIITVLAPVPKAPSDLSTE